MMTEFTLAALISEAVLFYTGMPEKLFPQISAFLFSYKSFPPYKNKEFACELFARERTAKQMIKNK